MKQLEGTQFIVECLIILGVAAMVVILAQSSFASEESGDPGDMIEHIVCKETVIETHYHGSVEFNCARGAFVGTSVQPGAVSDYVDNLPPGLYRSKAYPKCLLRIKNGKVIQILK
jgi:hypothetical protein